MGRFFFLLFMVVAMSLSSCNGVQKTGDATNADGQSENDSVKKNKVVSLAFVGDVMMGTNFPDSSYVTKDRGRSLFDDCKSIVTKADFAVANLEGTMYFGTDGERRKMTNPRTYFIFRMPGDHAQNLVDAGFDAVGIANNHSFDFGMTGRKKTLENIRRVGLGVSGIKEMAEVCILERNGITYGFLQFAASCTNTLDLNSDQDIEKYISETRKKCDVLVVNFHGGAEGTSALHVPMKQEYYVGENRGDVVKFSHKCIDLGADIVVGHGPHVPRAMELYKGHLIAYSLGNFCTPTRMGIAGATGIAPLLEAKINSGDGTFVEGKINSYRQVSRVGPRLDSTNEAAKLIGKLTQSDFPQSGLNISEDGTITLAK